jgi:phage baseplate assembly protein W
MAKELAFPFRIDSTGGIAFVTSQADVLQQRVISAVGTEPGERVMRPEYGTPTAKFLFAAMDPGLQDDLRESITTSVSTLVPEVTVTSVDLGTVTEDGLLAVEVHYMLTNGLEGSAKTSLQVATGTEDGTLL